MHEHIEKIFQAVADDSRWPADDVEGLCRLLADAAIAYGITCEHSIIPYVSKLYDHCLEVAPEPLRLQAYMATQDALFSGHTSTNALFPFIFTETSAGIVAGAAMDYAILAKSAPDDALAGPRLVAQWVKEANPANRGAIFGGLINIGDARVDAILDDTRDHLSPDEIRVAGMATTGMPTVAALEFWMRWLERLLDDGHGSTQLFGVVAHGLEALPKTNRIGFFAEVARTFGYCPADGAEGSTMLDRLSAHQVAERYGDRLYRLEATEPAPKVMSNVLLFYGLSPRAPSVDRAPRTLQ